MGVPKFYRWISERYPCLSETVKDYQIPEFDNLYLDMNGIIHICSHPEDDNPHFRITEEKIFKDIFHYIEVLYRMIKPKKVFFMAVDGVAPRAKMNQQRGRRFKSAREAESLVQKAIEKGEILPKEERFDSNCITPGTSFMARLQEQLKYFVVNKVTVDPLWQGPRIYLSGHQTPGEGEHKIMDFIRYERSCPGYDPNTRHCLYGLDADLIMLGLTSHDPHFSLLREEVRFGGKNAQKRSNTAEETTFHLLHLSLMREYLDFEFQALKSTLTFPYDLESIIDDWVLMGFLVGNDFIPHLPHVHIHAEALPLLWKTYIEVMPTLDGYLNEGGKLNLPRFEKYLAKLAQYDIDHFNDTYADLKWLESKVGGKAVNKEAGRAVQFSRRNRNKIQKKGGMFDGIPTANQYMSLLKEDGETSEDVRLIELEKDLGVAPLDCAEAEVEEVEEEVEEDGNLFRDEFRHHKDAYYMEKLRYEQVTPAVLREQAEGYVKAIQWILYYYYDGVPSWSWFYAHHYAPYISDVKDFADMKIEFDLGRPFLPFQQLMAVLPAASKTNLPTPFHQLMVNATSPVIDFYPVDFETDLNGKMQDWEAVVLIPFIEEDRLLMAMLPLIEELTQEEKGRNAHGPHYLTQHSSDTCGTYHSTLPAAFPDIVNHHAKVTEVRPDGFVMERSKLVKGLYPGVKLDLYFPGFPTLKHLEHSAILKKCGVKVFQMNSRNDNMMLEILAMPEPDIEQIAKEYVGRSVYVNWPHLEEARVLAVCDGSTKYRIVEEVPNQKTLSNTNEAKVEIHCEELERSDSIAWSKECDRVAERYHDRKGVEIGFTHILLYASPMIGRKYICGHHGNITLEKQWSEHSLGYVLQATVKDISVKDPSFQQYKTLDQLLPVNSKVFMLGSPHYGCMGEVLTIDPKNDGRVRVDFTILQEPDLDNVVRQERTLSVKYMPGYLAAQRLGISGFLVSRITGTVFVTRGSRELQGNSRLNIGLNLKFNKKNEEVPGYTKKTEDGWMYSQKTLEIISDYIKQFPELFDYLSKNTREDMYFEEDIFGEESEEQVRGLQAWLKKLPCASAARCVSGSEVLDEAVVAEIEKEVDMNNNINRRRKKHVKMQVRPHLLYRALEAQRTILPDTSVEFELYDRIINVREGYSVPLGLRGTVTGLHPAEKQQETVYDIVFDEEFPGGLTLSCSPNRGYRIPAYAIVNLSHGERKNLMKTGYQRKPTAVVKPQAAQYGSTASFDGQYNVSKNSAQYPRQPRNHGPPQAGRSGYGGQEPRDYIRTGRSNDHQDRRYNGPSTSQSKQQDSEFANIWQQLQTAAPVGKSPKQGPPAGKNVNQNNKVLPEADPSLDQAARALEAARLSHPDHGPPQHSIKTRQKDDSKPEPRTNERSEDAMIPGTSDEFLSLMKSLEISVGNKHRAAGNLVEKTRAGAAGGSAGETARQTADGSTGETAQQVSGTEKIKMSEDSGRPEGQAPGPVDEQQSKEGTAALYQILKIGQPPPELSTALTKSQVQPNSTKSYGRQVSIQELFQGAKQQEQSQPHPVKGDQPPPPYQSGQLAPTIPPKQTPGKQSQNKASARTRSRVSDLQQWCQVMGMPMPRYDYNYGPDKRVSAVVSLATGVRYQGSMTRSLDQAAESAASNAILNMQQQKVGGMNKPLFFMGSGGGARPAVSIAPPPPPPPQQPPSGAFCSSPNSAFTPVVPAGKGIIGGSSGPSVGYQSPGQPFPNAPVRTAPPPQQAFLHTKHPYHSHPPGPRPHQFHGPPGGPRFPGQGHPRLPHGGYGPRPVPHLGPRHHQPPHSHRGMEHPPPHHQHPSQHRGSWDRWPQQVPVQHQGTGRDDDGPEPSDLPKTPSKNPFVPLQVMRQQKTPQRETKPEASPKSQGTESLDVRSSPQPPSQPTASPGGTTGTHDKLAHQNNPKPPSDSVPHNKPDSKPVQTANKPDDSGSKSSTREKGKTTSSSGTASGKAPHPKRGRSRLAANFGLKN